jgi:hypothetical protein
MSGIGPIEPGEGTGAGPGAAQIHDIISGAAPPPSDRRRRAALALTAAAALGALAGYAFATRPGPSAPAPDLWPAQITRFSYAGPAEAADRDLGTFTFWFLITVAPGPPVTVQKIAQPYPGLITTVEPATPFTVHGGTTRRVSVHIYIRNCATLPLNAGISFIDVTLRNTRAIQTQSFIFDGRYPRELFESIRIICPRSVTKSP